MELVQACPFPRIVLRWAGVGGQRESWVSSQPGNMLLYYSDQQTLDGIRTETLPCSSLYPIYLEVSCTGRSLQTILTIKLIYH